MTRRKLLVIALLSLLLFTLGCRFLLMDSWFMAERFRLETGRMFKGASLRYLALCLISMGGYLAAGCQAYLRGIVPMPDASSEQKELALQLILRRYWYWLVSAAICFAMAFWLAEPMANPHFVK